MRSGEFLHLFFIFGYFFFTMKQIPGKYLLYADDDPDDRETVTEILSEADPTLQVVCVPDGRETMRFLDKLPAGTPLPRCIVLDVNMPIWNGLYTLEQLKASKEYSQLPVFMFSSSMSRIDYDQSLSLGAEDFINKPVRLDEMKQVGGFFKSICGRAVSFKL